MNVPYNHSQNTHSINGARAALPVLFASGIPESLLDVGCGTATWLWAAINFGVRSVFGIDGVELSADQLHVGKENVRQQDLTQSWQLGRRFDAVFCLEVAEHLDTVFAPVLIDSLVTHGDQIYFSAACPGQVGEHHVNCQWPVYWQQLFNDRGFVCDDSLRWRIWDDPRIEPWYRQNLFLAQAQSGGGRRGATN